MYTDESGKNIYPCQAWILERIKWNEVRETERKREMQEKFSDPPRQNVCVSIVVKWGESQATYFNMFKLEKKGLGWSQGNFFVFVCHRITIISTKVTHGCCEYKKTMCLSVKLPSLFLMSVQWESEENELQVHLMDKKDGEIYLAVVLSSLTSGLVVLWEK